MQPDVLATVERRHHIRVADGLQVVGAGALAVRPIDPVWPLLLLPSEAPSEALGALAEGAFQPTALPGRAAHPAAALPLLRTIYPPDHPVLAVGEATDTTVGGLTEAALAADAWLVPGLAPARAAAGPFELAWLVARLRAPDGCPWDREQTHLSLRKHLLEEAYEVYDALEGGATPELAGELGDLLLQVVLHAQYGAEAGVFDLADVQASISAKIVRRHPHVFGDARAATVGDVLRNWEAIKAAERAQADRPAAADPAMPAAFAGLSRSLPALAYAQEIQERAASLGYDWPDLEGIIDKVAEEAAELLAADGPAERAEEFGDLLLVLVNLGRRLGVDAEAALRGASAKFAARFAHVARLAEERHLALGELSLDELDELWVLAKRRGRSEDHS